LAFCSSVSSVLGFTHNAAAIIEVMMPPVVGSRGIAATGTSGSAALSFGSGKNLSKRLGRDNASVTCSGRKR
jgi:hypothetical protein